ncbi:MAG: 30S ribosomal protein S20 [bacterium]
MPIHKSALKRARQNETRRQHNVAVKSTLKTYTKKVIEAVEKKDVESAKNALNTSIKMLDKAVSKGIIHKNNAGRRKSKLTIKVNKLSSM